MKRSYPKLTRYQLERIRRARLAQTRIERRTRSYDPPPPELSEECPFDLPDDRFYAGCRDEEFRFVTDGL